MARRSCSPFVALALVAALSPGARAQVFVAANPPDIAAHVAFSTGATWVDHDGDGDLDLFVTTAFGTDNRDVLYRNDGGGAFVRIAPDPTLANTDGVCSTWADYDDDGVVDAFVSGLGTAGGVLYRGLGGGTLTAVPGTGVSSTALKGTGCAWGDYDNDGHVDLVVSVLNGVLGMTGGNRLFHNDGDGTFTEVVTGPPVTTPGMHHHVTWADADGDGDLDLFFATGPVGTPGLDRMYRNQKVETGTATFTTFTAGALSSDVRDSQTLSWADYDNDGDLDCYAINYTSVPNQLYRNDGATFTKLTTGAIVTDAGAAHGVTWGDFDNDGDLDCYVATDLGQVNRYYRNDGADTFTRILVGPHVTQALSNYGVAAADFDGDGDLDLFVPTARSEGASALFRNDLAPGSHWLELCLMGGPSNRSAIGARVTAWAVIGGTPRRQTRVVAAGAGYGGHDALDLHFGLADAAVLDSLVIAWPSGHVTRMPNVAADTRLTIAEWTTNVDVPAAAPGGALALEASPNPFVRGAALRFRLERAGAARVTVHDPAGRAIATLASGAFEAGWHTLALDAASLPGGGIYLVRVTSGGHTATRRIVLLR